MDSLAEKVEKLERAYFDEEGANVAYDNESPPRYNNGGAAIDDPIFSSPNMEMHPPIPIVVILLSLVCENCKPAEVKE